MHVYGIAWVSFIVTCYVTGVGGAFERCHRRGWSFEGERDRQTDRQTNTHTHIYIYIYREREMRMNERERERTRTLYCIKHLGCMYKGGAVNSLTVVVTFHENE